MGEEEKRVDCFCLITYYVLSRGTIPTSHKPLRRPRQVGVSLWSIIFRFNFEIKGIIYKHEYFSINRRFVSSSGHYRTFGKDVDNTILCGYVRFIDCDICFAAAADNRAMAAISNRLWAAQWPPLTVGGDNCSWCFLGRGHLVLQEKPRAASRTGAVFTGWLKNFWQFRTLQESSICYIAIIGSKY